MIFSTEKSALEDQVPVTQNLENTQRDEGVLCSLAELSRGQTCVVQGTDLDAEDEALLRAMGVRPNCQLRVCQPGQPCIIQVLSAAGPCCRVGLANKLAKLVKIQISV